MMEWYLRSRTESGNPSNVDGYDEDVNVYIVDLMCMLLDPVCYLQVENYVADNDSDVFAKIRDSSDNRLRYWVYKTNADHLLVSLGVFGTVAGEGRALMTSSGEPAGRAEGRGKAYYDFAASYAEALYRGSKGVSDVLRKLSHGFEKYVDILSHMRSEYLSLIDTLSEGEAFHLQRGIEQVRMEEHLKKKYDELLDLYLEWKRTGDYRLLTMLKMVSDELEELDPAFGFDTPEPVPS